MFVGCALAPRCPRALMRAAGEGPAVDTDYRSPLSSWGERASVRAKPERVFRGVDSDTLFPRALVPISGHRHVLDLGAGRDRETVARHLLRYLDFTAKLEHLVVNRTALGIAHDLTGFRFSDEMRMDAYRIYCDEGYHAYFSAKLAAEVAGSIGLRPDESSTPYFLTRLEQILADAGDELAPLIEVLFVVCSETLISSTLAEVADSSEVDSTVRAVIRDHAHDESRHHAYFAAVLREIWPQLNVRARQEAGRFIPSLITAFLAPDFADIRRELASYGLADEEIDEVLDDAYPSDLIRRDVREMARYTVQHFANVGALDDPQTAERFAAAGLLAQVPEPR